MSAPEMPGFYDPATAKALTKAEAEATDDQQPEATDDQRPAKRHKGPPEHQKNNETVRNRWKMMQLESGLLGPAQVRDINRERIVGLMKKSATLRGDVLGISGSSNQRITCMAVMFKDEGVYGVDSLARCCVVVCGTNMGAIVWWVFTRRKNPQTGEWEWNWANKEWGLDNQGEIIGMLSSPVTDITISPAQGAIMAICNGSTNTAPQLHVSLIHRPEDFQMMMDLECCTIWSVRAHPTTDTFAVSTDTGVLVVPKLLTGTIVNEESVDPSTPDCFWANHTSNRTSPSESLCAEWLDETKLISGHRNGMVCVTLVQGNEFHFCEPLLTTTGGPVLNLSIHRPPSHPHSQALLLVDSLKKLELYDITPLWNWLQELGSWDGNPLQLQPIMTFPLVDHQIKRDEGERMHHAFGVDWDYGIVWVGNSDGKIGVFSLETGAKLGREMKGDVCFVESGGWVEGGGLCLGRGGKWEIWTV